MKHAENSLKTIVRLVNMYKPNLIEASALSLDEISYKLANHCLIYYLCDDLPEIEIYDKESSSLVRMSEIYEKLSQDKKKEFPLKNFNFTCYVTKTEKTGNRKHNYSYFCANSRVVGNGRNLSKISSLFQFPIIKNGITYFLDIYVVSEFLNKKVYRSRNGFSILNESDLGLHDQNEITYEDINHELSNILEKEYDEFVKETKARNIEEIKTYIKSNAPEFRRFIHKPGILNSIPANLTNEKKDEYLYKLAYQERK